MAQCYPPIAKTLIDVGWILQYPPPSKDDFVYLAKQFNIKNTNKDDFIAQLPPPEKPVSPVQTPKKDEDSAAFSANPNDQTQNESEIEDDRSFCEKVAAILRPLGFAIRNGPDMVTDLTRSVQNICDVVKKIEDIDLEDHTHKSKK